MKRIIFTAGYLENDDELTKMKGHRSDVLVEKEGGLYFELNFIDLQRLEVELNSNMEKGRNYYTDTGLILVDQVSKDSIVKAVIGLDQKNFFFTQKPLKITPEEQWFYIDY
ncbi:hypothetical protein [Fluviicola sp.]|uniref:hypothetical protein n=1 Tax=Fluviicola sp. TaxID=1917219 RepID=UPI003D2C26ED